MPEMLRDFVTAGARMACEQMSGDQLFWATLGGGFVGGLVAGAMVLLALKLRGKL